MAAKFELGEPTKRTYGYQTRGRVISSDEVAIPVTIRGAYPNLDQIKDSSDSASILVLANGLGAGRNSMRTPAIEAIAAGKTALTFDYTNLNPTDALRSNADTMKYVFDALPEQGIVNREGLGLSMGGAVLALTLSDTPMHRATFVSPGGFIPNLDAQTATTIAQHFAEQFMREVVHERMSATKGIVELLTAGMVCQGAIKDWETDWRCTGSSLKDMIGRRAAVHAELSELISGRTVSEEFRAAMSGQDAPTTHLYYADDDLLVPTAELVAATSDLPFTTRQEYAGGVTGHTRLVHDPKLATHIFANERLTPHDMAA